MNKDLWDKLGIVATFVQIIVIGGFTAFVTYNTSVMNHKIESFKTGMEENTMIAKLVTDLTGDTVRNLKTDFALLSLERYLRSSKQGHLEDYDKKMLIGFAKSIIMDRMINSKADSSDNIKKIYIEKEFLNSIDTGAYNSMLAIVSGSETKKNIPDSAVSEKGLMNTKPVVELSNPEKSQAISALFSKTCYIQYSSDQNKQVALEIQKSLKDAGWYAPGIQLVKGNYRSVVKYFHAEDQQLAEKVVALAKGNAQTLAIKGYEAKVPVGQLEIWIGNGNP